MNAKRKAELQRKLAMAPVPKPPAGLAERIKNDIPEYLRPDADRARLTRSVAFNMRVAAAVLVIISSALGAVYLLDLEEQPSKIATVAPQQRAREMAADQYAAKEAATDEVQVEITQEAPAAPVMQIANVTTSAPEPRRRAEVEDAPAAGYVTGGTAAGSAMPTEVAFAAPPPPPAAAPAPAPAPEPVSLADTTTAAAEPQRAMAKLAAPSLVREAHAAEVAHGPAKNVFGISVDPEVFHKIKETLEDNKRPGAGEVNVEAIINYFAGAPQKKVRRGVKLEVEGSPSPVERIGQIGYLRFTIDTASAESRLPVAARAKVEIDLNGKVVEHAQPAGDTSMLAQEEALLHNLSVTGLYELTLRPNLRASDRVATIRLTYTDVASGKPVEVEKTVYARDFAKLWTRASRRHRLASLGAVWGQSLKSTSPAPEVARRAEELATQDPEDARAQELATAATASSKLNSGF